MNGLAKIAESVINRREYLFGLLIQHIVLSATAIAIITIIGLIAGVAALRYRRLRHIIMGVVNFLYTIPSIAMFGLFIPLIGIGFANALIVLVIYGLMPMIRSTYTGLSEVNAQLLDAAKGMGATPLQVFFRIRWPLAFPTIISGFRTMVVMTIALAGLASFIGAGGLGQAIYRGINTNNSGLIIIGSLSVAILALGADFIIGFFERSMKMKSSGLVKRRKLLFFSGILLMLIVIGILIFTKPPKQTDRKIVVASKPTAEQFILGEIISQLIENNTNISVERKFGIGGGTSNIHPAMLKGDIDIYPEYTGTSWLFVLKKKRINDADSLYTKLKEDYQRQYNLTWLCRFGFNNTFTLAMPDALARKYKIKTFSGLARKSPDLNFGAEFDFFERDDGFKGLKKMYPFHFKKTVELDINLKFQALENHTVDVIDAFSTDSRIKQMNLRVLEDNKNFFPSYQAGIVARTETLQKYPELLQLLKELEGTINDSIMLHMNYEAEIDNKPAAEIAHAFLATHHLIQ